MWAPPQERDPVLMAKRWRRFLKEEEKKEKKDEKKPKAPTFTIAQVFVICTITSFFAPLWMKLVKNYLLAVLQ
jgi:hypothetical protein